MPINFIKYERETAKSQLRRMLKHNEITSNLPTIVKIRRKRDELQSINKKETKLPPLLFGCNEKFLEVSSKSGKKALKSKCCRKSMLYKHSAQVITKKKVKLNLFVSLLVISSWYHSPCHIPMHRNMHTMLSHSLTFCQFHHYLMLLLNIMT